MSHTNSTSNYGLPQWIGTDKPTFLGDFNTAFYDIDAQMKNNADAAAAATSTANTAASTATTASTNATTALNTANSAASEAASATSAAASATATANTAASNAATALTASQANNIANLAPAYDPTLTYSVGDLVTYVDTETNTGKLYKCIVAVASPEAFNINKWDDVTTSEVYENIYKERTWNVTSGSLESLTYTDVFNFMIANEIKDCRLIRCVGSTYVMNFDESTYSSNNSTIKFSNVNVTKTGTILTSCVGYYESDNTYINRTVNINSSGAVSYTNNDADTFSADGVVKLLYK